MVGQAEQWEGQIEGIVRDVLARLQANGRPTAEIAKQSASTALETDVPTGRSRATGLVLDEAVVTLAALEGRLDGVREVAVRAGAVVTPAARDVLRDRGVVLSRNGDAASSDLPGASEVVIGVAGCRVEPVNARRLKEVVGMPVELLARVGLIDVVREISEQIVLGGKKGILFTTEAAAALCLANRRRGVRAVAASDAREVDRTAASVGANLLVIRPEGLTTWNQLSIAREFVNCGQVKCPAEYADSLG
jgi:hypothetical protein